MPKILKLYNILAEKLIIIEKFFRVVKLKYKFIDCAFYHIKGMNELSIS